MNDVQLAQLKAMSPAGRIGHYLKKKIAGEISAEKYDQCIAFALSLEDKTINDEGTAMVVDTRQTNDVRELEQAGSTTMDSSGERCEQAQQPVGGERTITGMEFVDSLSLPVVADGTFYQRRSEEMENTGSSQKAKLLKLLLDGEFHATPQIQEVVYGSNHLGCARIAARADDLRRDGYIIESRKISRTIWEYRLGQKDERITQIVDNMMAG